MAIHTTDVIEAFHSERKEQKNGKTSWLVAMHGEYVIYNVQ